MQPHKATCQKKRPRTYLYHNESLNQNGSASEKAVKVTANLPEKGVLYHTQRTVDSIALLVIQPHAVLVTKLRVRGNHRVQNVLRHCNQSQAICQNGATHRHRQAKNMDALVGWSVGWLGSYEEICHAGERVRQWILRGIISVRAPH